MVGQTNSVRSRQVFSVVNAGTDLSDCGSSGGGVEFTREDVESLLNEKMKGKNKFDYKVGVVNCANFWCFWLFVDVGVCVLF